MLQLSTNERPRCWLVAVAMAVALLAPGTGISAWTHGPGDSKSNDGTSLLPPQSSSLLIDYYEALIRTRDIEAFRRDVSGRFNEATLARMIQSSEPRARQASILALGLFGSYASNAAVARGLRDPDSTVREMAAQSLWLIWFRADSAENNKTLEQIRSMIGRGMIDEAIKEATVLIARSPTFAEAYNERAIAYYESGRLAESIDDCRKVLEHNPYHFGALGGMGQCQLRLGQTKEALETFRRALKLQPRSEGLKEVVSRLEEANP